ncbi:MAG: type II toxin-antitoxin system VapC family toxin [Deltaproteobacteria bacterium]|nr:type II toxin-antitoxin system VapC family toxin [Deltaproteobacteria bacterium]
MALPVVLDTSIVIKWFRQEEVWAEEALGWRDAYLAGRAQVWVPSLLVYEFSNVMRYKKDMSTEQVKEAVVSLYDMGLKQVLPSGAEMCRAIEVSREFQTTVYDAVFAVLAESLNASFVTADERLVKQLAALPFVRFLGDGD